MRVVGEAPGTLRTAGHDRPRRYLLLTGAKLNGGDFLIGQRSRELLSALRPGAELRAHDRWQPLAADMVEWADALLLCGGPALQPAVWPDVYPLLPSLDDIGPPIIGLGLGWKGTPGDVWTERTYRFSRSGRRLLERLEHDGWPVSCRDAATERVLRRCGVARTVLTGDPAWFEREHVGRPFEAPGRLDRCIVSMPASPMFFPQAVDLLRALHARHAPGRLLAGFNHGWRQGEHLDTRRAAAYRRLRSAVTELGVECVDASGEAGRLLELADACDLHVGYRLHTHLLFLGRRKPSLLLEEDGRGSAAAEALGLPGVRAWRRSALADAVLPAVSLAGRAGRPALRRIQARMRADGDATARMMEALHRHESEGFAAFESVARRIDQTYECGMRPFVESLP